MQKDITVNNKKSKKNRSTQETGSKARVKQKSLLTIFAKKLKETGIHNILHQSQTSSQVRNTTKVPEISKIKQSNAIGKKTSKSNEMSSTINIDATNEPIVSFINTVKGQFGKTLLAKKRNISGNEQKKSLSDIFSSQSKNQMQLNVSTIQKHDIDKNNIQSKEPEVVAKESFTLKDKMKKTERDRQQGKDKNKKTIKKHERKIANNKEESDKTPKVAHKAGKISSLFGNNPNIPTIGQRLVKPVNEPIFTEITFEDLNIHPFMVSSLHA